ncbi:MAG: glycosyltransferase family 2 protein [Gemmataceae bacterium]
MMSTCAEARPSTHTLSTRQTDKRRFTTAGASATPELSIVIVNYCQWQNTTALVRVIQATAAARQGAVEVVVVDNHSAPHPLCQRLRHWPGVAFRRWRGNQGFARAANAGCRLSQGRWLLLLNPDTSLPPQFINEVLALSEHLTQTQSRVGIVGFGLRHSDGSRQLSSGPFPTLWSTLLGLLRPRQQRKYHAVSSQEFTRVPWVTGCCLLARRECLRQVGGFDDRFFLYYEDVDLCRRATAKGWHVGYEPRIHAVHHRPLHTRPVPSYLRVVTRHALLTYAAKHWPRWQFRALAALIRGEAWGRYWLARLLGNAAAAEHFAQLPAVITDIRQGWLEHARQRIKQLARRCEHQAQYDMQNLDTPALFQQRNNSLPQGVPAPHAGAAGT